MSYFNEDFNQFFIELAANNNKDWFDANRSRYQKNVKEPFEKFVGDLIAELKKDDPELAMKPKDCIFRINRDIRFSNDKSPYKLNRSAAISKYGRKEMARTGLYVQLGPEMVWIAGGAYMPDKDQLLDIRMEIAKSPKAFHDAINDPRFKETFGALQGEENKRLPNKELTEAAVNEPMLYKKQFYYSAEFPPDIITDDLLVEFIAEKHRDSKSVRDFLEKAMA
jgi:uncharacterized protein (TIGR02453 family)